MTERATFAAGCFWGVEDAFRSVPGVVDVTAGYAGGHVARPSYEMVCTDTTGHAEAVEVEYDPAQVSFDQLMDVFWSIHDPSQRDRQGLDVGRQYRSAIFFHTPAQEQAARAALAAEERSGRHGRAIATEVVAAGDFWPAEEYHQRYLERMRARSV